MTARAGGAAPGPDEVRDDGDVGSQGGEGDWRGVEEELREVVGEVHSAARQCIDGAPLTAVGVAAGLGFVLGGGLPQGATAVLVAAALRAGASYLGNDLGDWLDAARNPDRDDASRARDARARDS